MFYINAKLPEYVTSREVNIAAADVSGYRRLTHEAEEFCTLEFYRAGPIKVTVPQDGPLAVEGMSSKEEAEKLVEGILTRIKRPETNRLRRLEAIVRCAGFTFLKE